jgi:hypothetical protein
MISTQHVLNDNNCDINSNYCQIVKACIFLFSLIIFKFLFNKENQTNNFEKAQRAKAYLKEYEKENEEFFFGNGY